MSKQEPKQIKCYCGHTTMCDCGEQPKQETLEEDRLKRSDKLWKKLVKELSVLNDNNYAARQLFDYIERHYCQPPLGNNMPPVGEQKCVVPNCKKEPIKEAFHGLCSQHIWPNG